MRLAGLHFLPYQVSDPWPMSARAMFMTCKLAFMVFSRYSPSAQ